MITILDCYTDEPAGLGVPPYLGVYPRYLYGFLKSMKNYENNEKKATKNNVIKYLTIDDVRLWKNYNGKILFPSKKQKTNISTNNLTKNYPDTEKILRESDKIYVILGIHTPGKYLSAVPGTIKEIEKLIPEYKSKIIFTGPAVSCGTQLFGGEDAESVDPSYKTFNINFSYKDISVFSVLGSEIVSQINDLRLIEIETSHGCSRNKGCSFCTEPLKNKFEFRDKNSIIQEIKSFYDRGCVYFRLGKQSCIYSYPGIDILLYEIRKNFPKIKVLHIDNVNPVNVVNDFNNNNAKITKAIVQYCTPGNVAAFGIESFDINVVKENNLNTTPEIALKAIEIINNFGSKRAENGMHYYLPGINILFGLIGETKKTNEENMRFLKIILEKFLIRRINIREVVVFKGTPLERTVGNKIIKKNSKFYWKWRNQIRQEIDFPMLKKLFPEGTVLKEMYAEIYDGNTTFLRQIGTYPIIVGVRGRVELKKFYNVKIKGHMLRSLIGEII